MGIADFASGFQSEVQRQLAQRIAEQQYADKLKQQAFENQRQIGSDARAQQGMDQAAQDRQDRLQAANDAKDAAGSDRRIGLANTLADQIPENTFMAPTDPGVGILKTGGRGSLLREQQERGAIESGPLLPGDKGEARQQGFIKTSSAKQIDTTTDNARQAAQAAETARHNLAVESKPNASTVVNLSPNGLDLAAGQYAETGVMPPMGMGSAATRAAIINRAAELHPGLHIAESAATYGADKASLSKSQQMRDAIGAFENTASKNADVMEGLAKKLTDTGSPFLNRPWREVQARGGGDPNVAAFAAARRVVVNEYARITSNPSLAGVLTDEARREMDAVLSGDATIPQMVAVMRVLRQDATNRRTSLDDVIANIKGRTGGRTPPPQAEASPGATGPQDGQEGNVGGVPAVWKTVNGKGGWYAK